MANNLPKVGGRIVLEGEADYRRALKDINQQLTVNYSEMQLVTAEYAQNANSVEALTKKKEVLTKVLEQNNRRVEEAQKMLEQAKNSTGDNASAVAKWQTELTKAQVAVKKTENSIAEYDDAIKQAKNPTINFGDAIDGIADKLGIRLPEGMRNAVGSLGEIPVATAAAAAGVAAVVAVLAKVGEELANITNEVAKQAGDIGTKAQEYSITAEQVQELAYAEEKLEVSQGTITSSMTKLTSKIADNAEAFKQLHVSVKENGELRDTYDVYMDVIDALGNMQNQTEADAMAQELFGKSFVSIKPIIEAGSKSIDQYSKAAKENGLIMSNDQVKAMDKLYQKQVDVDAGWNALKQTLAVKFAPALEDIDDMIINDLQPVMKDLAESIIPLFTDVFGGATTVIKLAASPILQVAAAFTAVAATLETVIAYIDAAVQGFNMLTGKQSSFNWSAFDTAQHSWSTSAKLIGKGFDYGIIGQAIGHNALGTSNWKGGLTWVGENGPELVSLPRGSKVYSNAQSNAIAGSTYNITIDASRVQEFNDIIRIAQNETMSIRQGVSR